MLVSASNGATTKLSLLNSQTNFRIYLNPEVFLWFEKCTGMRYYCCEIFGLMSTDIELQTGNYKI